ncbi:S-adenosyl-L-methionine-dependent methyltransferase [Aspergillus undulatus]|uniref:S-adenosyl-L-methionine-dependent methyltransferase n=1 Tax=Aspergillus undulatus TaxID=1810928 RepID=UPI003CCD1E83
MPRLATRLVLQAYKHDHLLPLLLRECRSLDCARNELRWLRERAVRTLELRPRGERHGTKHAASGWRGLLRAMCLARSRGMPLQYILGDQPFGDLDIKCAKGVLIPRHETEAITLHAAELILNRMAHSSGDNPESPLRIMDLCTGTGCIPLLLHSLLSPYFSQLSIVGIDLSAKAVSLAKENTSRNVRLGKLSERALAEVVFRRGNVLEYSKHGFSSSMKGDVSSTSDVSNLVGPRCDVLVSNPPYVSVDEYRGGTTSRSVRIFEPRLALVPPRITPAYMVDSGRIRHEDIFYSHIANLVLALQVRMAILECGSCLQAMRVAALYEDIFRRLTHVGHVVIDVWPVTGVDSDPCAVIVQFET